MSKRSLRWVALAGALALLAAACGGGGGSSGGGGGSAAGPPCPVDALSKAKGPVTLTFWHGLSRANETALQKLVDQYMAQQPKVKVELINQTGYREAFEKYKAGLTSGDLPDIVQMEDTATQQMIDTQSTIPVQSCINAEKYDMSDYIPRVTDYYTVEDSLRAMPFNVSNPVLYYDQNAFTAAGLDPSKPPSTLAEVADYAQKIKATGAYKYGFALKLDSWWIEQISGMSAVPYVNQGNGRSARATAATFDNPTGLGVLTWMNDLVKSGVGVTNSATGPSAFDNLLGIRSKNNAMTVDSSGALGTISQVLASGEAGGVKVGVGPMPGPQGKGGVLVGGAALYISRKSSAVQQSAAWDLAKFLTTSQNQAQFAAETGYVPIRKSSADTQVMKDLWAREPGYKVAYDQLVDAVNNIASAGPVIGAYQAVRDEVLAAEQQMFTQGKAPATALKDAATASTRAITDYNSRVVG